MTEQYISHHRPARKRALAMASQRRRLTALVVTLAAIIAAAWLAPFARQNPAQFPEAKPPDAAVFPVLPEAISTEVATAPAPAPRRRRAGVPLDADPGTPANDYEVLSAAELDAISQARDE